MRLNVYDEEITGEVAIVGKRAETGTIFSGIRVFLASPKELHNLPGDDDRSAITFWWETGNMAERSKVIMMLARAVTLASDRDTFTDHTKRDLGLAEVEHFTDPDAAPYDLQVLTPPTTEVVPFAFVESVQGHADGTHTYHIRCNACPDYKATAGQLSSAAVETAAHTRRHKTAEDWTPEQKAAAQGIAGA